MPSKDDPEFTRSPSGRRSRSSDQTLKAWEQATRQRWRALSLVVKAKLEAVETEITTFDEEFLAHIVLPNGKTVASWLVPQIAQVYEKKKMPALLPGV